MQSIGVGMLGYAFTGKAHARALAALRGLGVPLRPELVAIAGRDEAKVAEELAHLLAAIAGEGTVAPNGATFEDGWRADAVADAIARSAASGRREEVPRG